MSLLTMVVQQEEEMVYLNTDIFLTDLACCNPDNIAGLISVSFSTERVHFKYVLNSGQHIADSCTMSDYLKWKETL